MKKNIILLYLIFFLSNCGFTPIYQNNTKINFSIEQVSYSGDKELNNFLKTNLSKYENKNIDNIIYVETTSVYKKIILSKDATGEVTNYQLEAEVKFLIKSKNKEIIINENHIMNSKSDKFEETRYERIIKQNFASAITNKLLSELMIYQ
jgi:hypothetical protein